MENFGYLYSIAIAAGGIVGYVKKGSAMSLAAGVMFGSLAAAGTFQMSSDPQNCYLLLASSGTLALIMGFRAYKSRKFMPAGMTAALRFAVFNFSLKIFTEILTAFMAELRHIMPEHHQ